ncbi:MAG: phosphoglycerate mutase [Acidovorax sp.]
MPDTPHLLIPYAASGASDLPALPQLEKLLARLTPAETDTGDEYDFAPPHERALARALGLPATATPWAAWDQGSADACAWITPCHWQVGTDHVRLTLPELTEADSRALLALLEPWFAEDGITLAYDQPARWLARGAVFDGLKTASLDRVLNRDVRAWMPDPAQARTLHRLHSEMQMLLYTHPFNDARAERGLAPINAFWVHGAGRLAAPPSASAAPQVASDLRDAALRADWAAWATAWTALDAGPIAALAAHDGPVRLTLCGERSALSWHSAPRSLTQRISSLFRPQRLSSVREQL